VQCSTSSIFIQSRPLVKNEKDNKKTTEVTGEQKQEQQLPQWREHDQYSAQQLRKQLLRDEIK
jgi:hypothetical protein